MEEVDDLAVVVLVHRLRAVGDDGPVAATRVAQSEVERARLEQALAELLGDPCEHHRREVVGERGELRLGRRREWRGDGVGVEVGAGVVGETGAGLVVAVGSGSSPDPPRRSHPASITARSVSAATAMRRAFIGWKVAGTATARTYTSTRLLRCITSSP